MKLYIVTFVKERKGKLHGRFLVRVTVKDLRIRKGAGTDTAWTGKYVPPGTYTIVEVKAGKGSDAGWGRLKSGAGWIALSYAKRA